MTRSMTQRRSFQQGQVKPDGSVAVAIAPYSAYQVASVLSVADGVAPLVPGPEVSMTSLVGYAAYCSS